MILYATLLICAAGAAVLVYRYDMYEREPWWMLLIAAGLGAGAMWLMTFAEPASMRLIGDAWPESVAFAAVASSHEEIAKLAIVVAVATLFPSQFNDPMDGMIYGSIVGLGMAIEESIFYLRLDHADALILPGAEPIRLAGHLIMGGIDGFAIGMARAGRPRWPLALAACVAASMAIHFTWDVLAFSATVRGEMQAWQTLAAVGLMLGGLGLYGCLVTVASRWSRDVFDPGSPRSLWGWPFRRGSGAP